MPSMTERCDCCDLLLDSCGKARAESLAAVRAIDLTLCAKMGAREYGPYGDVVYTFDSNGRVYLPEYSLDGNGRVLFLRNS